MPGSPAYNQRSLPPIFWSVRHSLTALAVLHRLQLLLMTVAAISRISVGLFGCVPFDRSRSVIYRCEAVSRFALRGARREDSHRNGQEARHRQCGSVPHPRLSGLLAIPALAKL